MLKGRPDQQHYVARRWDSLSPGPDGLSSSRIPLISFDGKYLCWRGKQARSWLPSYVGVHGCSGRQRPINLLTIDLAFALASLLTLFLFLLWMNLLC